MVAQLPLTSLSALCNHYVQLLWQQNVEYLSLSDSVVNKVRVIDETPMVITAVAGSLAVLPCSADPRYTEQASSQYKVNVPSFFFLFLFTQHCSMQCNTCLTAKVAVCNLKTYLEIFSHFSTQRVSFLFFFLSEIYV